AGRRDCARVSDFASGHFQASAAVAPGPPCGRATRGAAPAVPVESGTVESGGQMAAAISYVLADQPGEFESVCRDRARKRSGAGETKFSAKRRKQMNAVRMVMAVVIVMVAGSVLAVAGSQQSFDAMKSLNGIWEGQGKHGKPLQVSFKVTAGGSALMSEIH